MRKHSWLFASAVSMSKRSLDVQAQPRCASAASMCKLRLDVCVCVCVRKPQLGTFKNPNSHPHCGAEWYPIHLVAINSLAIDVVRRLTKHGTRTRARRSSRARRAPPLRRPLQHGRLPRGRRAAAARAACTAPAAIGCLTLLYDTPAHKLLLIVSTTLKLFHPFGHLDGGRVLLLLTLRLQHLLMLLEGRLLGTAEGEGCELVRGHRTHRTRLELRRIHAVGEAHLAVSTVSSVVSSVSSARAAAVARSSCSVSIARGGADLIRNSPDTHTGHTSGERREWGNQDWGDRL